MPAVAGHACAQPLTANAAASKGAPRMEGMTFLTINPKKRIMMERKKRRRLLMQTSLITRRMQLRLMMIRSRQLGE